MYTDTIHFIAGGGGRMLITINPDDGRPLYEQVAAGIRSLIARGDLKEGDSLPPVRQIEIGRAHV